MRARLVFLMDAPKTYWRALPSGLTLEDIPKARRPKLPASMRGSTREVVEALGLSGATDYRQTLGTLVQHFRSFEPGSPPADSGDLYTDLALSKRGICRHRSYAFVVTAQALGIPSRYVFNEAHVFVEVWVPGERPGWMRIDLGGSAERLEIGGAEDKVRHEADEPDPFDRPLPFARSTRGGPSGRRKHRGRSAANAAPDAAERDLPSAPERTDSYRPAALTVSPDASPTRTTLTIPSPVVYRGEPFDIEGSVSAQGQAAPGTVQPSWWTRPTAAPLVYSRQSPSQPRGHTPLHSPSQGPSLPGPTSWSQSTWRHEQRSISEPMSRGESQTLSEPGALAV